MGPKEQGRAAAKDFKGAYGLPCEMTLTSPSRADGPHGARRAPSVLAMAFAAFASCLQARQGVYSKGVGNRLGPHGGGKIRRNSGCPEKPVRVQARHHFQGNISQHVPSGRLPAGSHGHIVNHRQSIAFRLCQQLVPQLHIPCPDNARSASPATPVIPPNSSGQPTAVNIYTTPQLFSLPAPPFLF